MIAVIGKSDQKQTDTIANELKRLALDGVVPKGVEPGHADGWGVVVFNNGQIVLDQKSIISAAQDPSLVDMKSNPAFLDSTLLIAHLRKASVGAVDINNVHPFEKNGYVFCHNGSIKDSDLIVLEKYDPVGTTDSERLFLWLLEKIEGQQDVQTALEKAIETFKKQFKYRALNFILTDGENIWAYRDFDNASEEARQMGLAEYYSLYIGKSRDKVIVSSEIIEIKDLVWVAIGNEELHRIT